VTNGYRKVAGDSCIGGVDHSPSKIPCPYFSFLGGGSWTSYLILFSVAAGIYWVLNNKEVAI